MSTVFSDAPPTTWTIADVHAHLPGFPDDRILTCPSPGTATEEDLLAAESPNWVYLRTDRRNLGEENDGKLLNRCWQFP